VTALFDYEEPRSGNFFVKPLTHRKLRQTVLPSPDDERRMLERAKLAVQDVFAAPDRLDKPLNRVLVTGGNPRREKTLYRHVAAELLFVIEDQR